MERLFGCTVVGSAAIPLDHPDVVRSLCGYDGNCQGPGRGRDPIPCEWIDLFWTCVVELPE